MEESPAMVHTIPPTALASICDDVPEYLEEFEKAVTKAKEQLSASDQTRGVHALTVFLESFKAKGGLRKLQEHGINSVHQLASVTSGSLQAFGVKKLLVERITKAIDAAGMMVSTMFPKETHGASDADDGLMSSIPYPLTPRRMEQKKAQEAQAVAPSY